MLKKCMVILFSFVVFFPGICLCVDLNAPAEKKITIGSEIDRGRDVINNAFINTNGIDPYKKVKVFQEIILQNKQMNTDTPAFLLGVYLEAWRAMDICSNSLKTSEFKDYYKMACDWALIYFKRFKEAQAQLNIDDNSLKTLRGLDNNTYRALHYRYERELKSSPIRIMP